MAKRVPLTTLTTRAGPAGVFGADSGQLSTTYADKVNELVQRFDATGDPLSKKKKRKATGGPPSKKRKRKRKAPNLDLRTMLRKERKAPKKRKPQGFYLNARTTLQSLIRQVPGSATPLIKLLKK